MRTHRAVSLEGCTAEMQPGRRPSRLAEEASTSSDNGSAVARGDGIGKGSRAYRQDKPASIVVQKPQCSAARKGAPAWAS
jgi:hypothetical protein